jgi:hypothetical protein
MHKYKLLSILIPAISILIIIASFLLIKPQVTGLAIYSPENIEKLVNADVILKTKANEVIPPDAIVQVNLDNRKAEMTINDFIMRTGTKFEVKQGELPEFDFYGDGFSGNHTYNLSLSTFDIDRNIGKGEHRFIIRIIYHNKILYEKEDRIMISE